MSKPLPPKRSAYKSGVIANIIHTGSETTGSAVEQPTSERVCRLDVLNPVDGRTTSFFSSGEQQRSVSPLSAQLAQSCRDYPSVDITPEESKPCGSPVVKFIDELRTEGRLPDMTLANDEPAELGNASESVVSKF